MRIPQEEIVGEAPVPSSEFQYCTLRDYSFKKSRLLGVRSLDAELRREALKGRRHVEQVTSPKQHHPQPRSMRRSSSGDDDDFEEEEPAETERIRDQKKSLSVSSRNESRRSREPPMVKSSKTPDNKITEKVSIWSESGGHGFVGQISTPANKSPPSRRGKGAVEMGVDLSSVEGVRRRRRTVGASDPEGAQTDKRARASSPSRSVLPKP
jgi:hypothetical protein